MAGTGRRRRAKGGRQTPGGAGPISGKRMGRTVLFRDRPRHPEIAFPYFPCSCMGPKIEAFLMFKDSIPFLGPKEKNKMYENVTKM